MAYWSRSCALATPGWTAPSARRWPAVRSAFTPLPAGMTTGIRSALILESPARAKLRHPPTDLRRHQVTSTVGGNDQGSRHHPSRARLLPDRDPCRRGFGRSVCLLSPPAPAPPLLPPPPLARL